MMRARLRLQLIVIAAAIQKDAAAQLFNITQRIFFFRLPLILLLPQIERQRIAIIVETL